MPIGPVRHRRNHLLTGYSARESDMAAEALFLTRRLSLRRLLFVAWRPGGRALSTSLGNPANYAGFPLCHSHHGRWLNLINRTFHVLRKLDVNLLRTVKLFGAAQEAGRGKAAHGQHTYCITPGDKYAVPASLPQKAACYGIGIPTAAELTRVNNHFPSIFFATPSRSTWLFAVQKGRPVAGFKDTSK